MNADGEFTMSHADAEVLVHRYRRLLDGQQLKIAKLEAEAESHASAEAGATDIRDVLKECKKVLMPRLKIVPGSEAWAKVKSRLNDFEVVELKAVPHGALKDRWYCAQRHRLRPQYLYRSVESTQELMELGLGVVEQTLPNGMALPRKLGEKLLELHPQEWDALDRCECGHLRFQHDHYASDGPMYGWHWCERCECTDYFKEYPSLKVVRDEEPPPEPGQMGMEAA